MSVKRLRPIDLLLIHAADFDRPQKVEKQLLAKKKYEKFSMIVSDSNMFEMFRFSLPNLLKYYVKVVYYFISRKIHNEDGIFQWR